jgi:hypothetical protein
MEKEEKNKILKNYNGVRNVMMLNKPLTTSYDFIKIQSILEIDSCLILFESANNIVSGHQRSVV